MSETLAVVMAAGKGTRMKTDLPKVLVPVNGRPMIEHVLAALGQGGIDRIIVVVGYAADRVRASLAGRPELSFALQQQQLGTGHAVMACRDQLADHAGPVLVVAGDAPLMQPSTVRALLSDYRRRPAACILGTVIKQDPTGLGRIVRDGQGCFEAIVEEKDATPDQRKITEVNMSYYVFHCPDLLDSLGQIRDNNAQREYYLTDCPGVLKRAGKEVRALPVLKPCEALGVNSLEELAAVEAVMARQADAA